MIYRINHYAPQKNSFRETGRGRAADFDGDGDVYVANSCHRGSMILVRANGALRENWIKVTLPGTKSKRQGLGALVRIPAGGRRCLQTYGSLGFYLLQHNSALHFGLGKETRVDLTEVTWPGGCRKNIRKLKPAGSFICRKIERCVGQTPHSESPSSSVHLLFLKSWMAKG